MGRVLCPCTVLYTLESTVTAPPTPECSVTTTVPPASECAVTAVSAPAASAPDSEEDSDHDCAAGDKIHLCAEEAGQYCIELYSSVEEGTDRRNDQPFEECLLTTTDPPASECAVTAVRSPAALAPDSEEGRDHDCAAGDKIHLCAEEAGQYCIEFYSSVEEGTDQRNDQPFEECSVTTTDPPASECAVTAVSAPAALAPDSEEGRDHDCAAGDKIHLCAEEAGQYCIEFFSSVEEGTDQRNDQPFEGAENACSEDVSLQPLDLTSRNLSVRKTKKIKRRNRPATGWDGVDALKRRKAAKGLQREFYCHYCPKVLTAASNLLRHERTHTGEKPYKCRYCPRRCADRGNLSRHEELHRSVKRRSLFLKRGRKQSAELQSTTEISERKKKQITKRRVRQAASSDGGDVQKRHNASTGSQRFMQCRYCSYRSCFPGNMKRHERTHTGEKPYKCRYCPRRSADRGNLSRHEELHLSFKVRSLYIKRGRKQSTELQPTTEISERKKKQITKHRIQNAVSSDGGDVQKRRNASTGSQRYVQCSYCPYKSCFPGNMKRHERTHTGEKPYECLVCHKLFADPSGLNRHKALHE
ncbi:uncharacterized protein LOC144093941 isoform X2 [Amblyomma americanum]